MEAIITVLKISSKISFIDIDTNTNEDLDKNSSFVNFIEKLTDIEIDKLINLEIQIPKIFYFLLVNKKVIHKILYDKDVTINIDNKSLGNNFHNYFYLVKLIEDQNEIVNYKYNFDIIKNLKNQKSKGKFYDILVAKILKILIANFEEPDDNIQEEINSIQEEINSIQEKINSIKEEKNNQITNSEQLKDIDLDDDIDTIYIHLIINNLLKSGKIEEKDKKEENFVKGFIEELDLENIEMTKTMCKELVDYFNNNINKDKEKDIYNIYDNKNINFYYNLFKYILKNNYYIYQINFLLELRQKILKIIRKKNQEFIDNYKKPNNERFIFIINFLLDSRYYYDKIIEPKIVNKYLDKNNSQNDNENISKNSSYDNTNKEKKESSSLVSQNQYSAYTDISENLSRGQSHGLEYDALSSLESENLEILKYGGKIDKKKEEDINSISKEIIEEKDKNNEAILEIDSNNEVIPNYNKYIKDDSLICLIKSKIGNLIVFDKFDEPTDESNKINYESEYFKITNISSSRKKYILTGAIGLLGNCNEDNEGKSYIRVNFTGGRKIMDNVYAFVSNKIYDHGENKLLIIDFLNHSKKKEIDNYSFNIGNNSLYLINADKDNKYKILLCACKSYVKRTKNGILMVLMEINNQEPSIFAPQFYPTDDFEVNCFLPIYENNGVHYILVGGFEVGKRRGNVKLYRLSSNIKAKKPKINYIQDAIEEFVDFDGMINNIVKNEKNDIIISCLYGDDYIFKLPKNNDYIKLYESLYE